MNSKLVSEFLGTAFLLAVVVGSGVMGEGLSGGNVAIALLANSVATGAGLLVLILCLSPVSGAHFNPAVSLIEWLSGRMSLKEMGTYICAQILGGVFGVLITHVMFQQTVFQISDKSRKGVHLIISEFVATFGLISVIYLAGRRREEWVPLSVASYITAAYWFTSSTSFANPAVTLARALTNTFCGIAPSDVTYFIVAQVLGAVVAFLLLKRLNS